MKKTNKMLILGTIFIVAAALRGKEAVSKQHEGEKALYSEIVEEKLNLKEVAANESIDMRRADTEPVTMPGREGEIESTAVTVMNDVPDEAEDDIFIEFVDGDVIEKPGENVEIHERHINRTNKKYKGNYVVFQKDRYGIVADNIDKLDEEYIISSKVFELTDIDDSLGPFNRRMYAFNTQLDRKVLYPASRIYASIVPKPIRNGIANFYNNFKEIPTMLNSLLQLKPGKAANALGRFVVNSTVGLLGTNDVAKRLGMKRNWETMGDTLGVYGIPTGSYLVLPFTGPSTVRDTAGGLVDGAMEGGVRRISEKELFFDPRIFDEKIYGFTRPVATGLNARSLISFRYGDLNSPFEYDLVRAMYYNYRKIQVVK